MTIDLDPDLITFGDPAAATGLAQVYYAGMPLPGLVRFAATGAGAATTRYYAAREAERTLEAMSAHRRLAFLAAGAKNAD